jgi:hypothetical protein
MASADFVCRPAGFRNESAQPSAVLGPHLLGRSLAPRPPSLTTASSQKERPAPPSVTTGVWHVSYINAALHALFLGSSAQARKPSTCRDKSIWQKDVTGAPNVQVGIEHLNESVADAAGNSPTWHC